MTDDPRLKVVGRWIGPKRLRTVPAGEELIPQMLAQLDGVDPLRRPVSQDRVDAALDSWFARTDWRRSIDSFDRRARMSAALAAADRVPAPAEPEAAPTADGDPAWKALICAARQWAGYMDQWTKFQFPTKFGHVFVTLSRMTPFPDEFTRVTPNDTRPAEKPDFPLWSREMWILLHYLAQKCQGQHPAERETMSYLLDQAHRAAVPETQDAQ